MEIADIQITGLASKDFEWKPITIVPVCDTHLGSGSTAEAEFRKYIERGIKEKAWFIGVGDYLDLSRWSQRAKWSGANLESSMADILEDKATQLENAFLHLVRGTEGKWLGMIEGNHWWQHGDGTTSDTRIAKALHAPWLGSCGFVVLTIRRTAEGSRGSHKYVIWLHHGKGAGIKLSAPMNTLENLSGSFQADLFLTAHQHKGVVAQKPILFPGRQKPFKVQARTTRLVSLGAWQYGYQQGHMEGDVLRGNYVEQKGMIPASIGGAFIRISPKHGELEDRVETTVET